MDRCIAEHIITEKDIKCYEREYCRCVISSVRLLDETQLLFSGGAFTEMICTENGVFYVELYLGIYDLDRRGVRRIYGKDGGGDECGTGFRGGCGVFVYHHDRCYGALGGADGDCTEVRIDRKADAGDPAFYQLPFSKDSQRASGKGVYCHEPDRQCAGAGLGLYAGGALSYYSDRLNNPLRNQGFPPNLVLMKKCSFASKHF